MPDKSFVTGRKKEKSTLNFNGRQNMQLSKSLGNFKNRLDVFWTHKKKQKCGKFFD